MKVKFVKTGEVAEFNDSYGARLIEQGRAVLAPAEKFPMNEPEEPKQEETQSAPAAKKSKKG